MGKSVSDSAIATDQRRAATPGELRFSQLGLRVLDCEDTRIDATWNTADVCSAYWRLYVNGADGASLRLKDGVYKLPPGRVHFIPPWVHFTCRNSSELSHFYVHFDLVALPGAVVRSTLDAPVSVPVGPLAAQLLGEVRLRVGQQRRKLADELAIKALVHYAVAQLLDCLPAADSARWQTLVYGDHTVQAALDHVETHLADKIRNEDLAAVCFLSRDHFARRFRQVVGQTPGSYIAERRVARSAQLLVHTACTIDEIAEVSGFPNRFYFSRVFKRHLGLSPGLYRSRGRV